MKWSRALSAQGPDHWLGDGIGLWCANRRGDGVYADTPSVLAKLAAVEAS
jgi:hypothetical protein